MARPLVLVRLREYRAAAALAAERGAARLAEADLVVADDSTIYFTEVYNSCVRKIDPAGVISTAVGTCGVRGYSGDGGPPAEATLDRPFGIELVGDKLYIADSSNHRIRIANIASP